MTEGGRTVLILFVTAAAASDLRRGRIYNFLTLPTLAAGLLLLMVSIPEEVPPTLGVMAATLLLLFPAFLLIRYRDLSRTVHFAVPIGISVVLCLLLEQLGIQSPSLVTF